MKFLRNAGLGLGLSAVVVGTPSLSQGIEFHDGYIVQEGRVLSEAPLNNPSAEYFERNALPEFPHISGIRVLYEGECDVSAKFSAENNNRHGRHGFSVLGREIRIPSGYNLTKLANDISKIERKDITAEEIALENGIDNPELIYAGQRLFHTTEILELFPKHSFGVVDED